MSTTSTTSTTSNPIGNKHNFSWQQTMLRIKDPSVSVPFYEKNFGFRLIHKYNFDKWGFSLYFLGIVPEGTVLSEPGTPESAAYLWSMSGTCLELTHNHGSENDENFKVNNGNVEPFRGFGHLAVMTPDVYKSCAELESNGVLFQKKPDEGRMKGIAFALDPDGYWIEVIARSAGSVDRIRNNFTLAQTMFRVKDPKKSLKFYCDFLGMTLLRESHYSDFSLYFLAHISESEKANLPPRDSPEASEYIRNMFSPVIELTHNHGTENNPDFKYHNGNDQENGELRGFGHVGFLVDDLNSACDYLENECGVLFKKKPSDGNMKEIAFVYDPDNYWVEIIQRNGFKE